MDKDQRNGQWFNHGGMKILTEMMSSSFSKPICNSSDWKAEGQIFLMNHF